MHVHLSMAGTAGNSSGGAAVDQDAGCTHRERRAVHSRSSLLRAPRSDCAFGELRTAAVSGMGGGPDPKAAIGFGAFMKQVVLTTMRGLLCLLAAISAAPIGAEDNLLRPEEAFRFSVAMVDQSTAEIHYQIAEGYYLYRDKFRFSAQPSSVKLGDPQLPAGKIKQDEYFGKVETYRHQVAIRIPVTSGSEDRELTLQATAQGCADEGLCYSPFKQSARLLLAAAEPAAGASKADSGGAMSKLRALTQGAQQEDFLPVEKAFGVEARVIDDQTVVVDFKPKPTY